MMTEKRLFSTQTWTILNLVVYFLTLGVNYLGSSGFINGMSQADISDKYMTLISPAGFTFSIWGVIYTLLLITLVYFFIKRNDEGMASLIQKVSPLFIVSSLFNMGWITIFSYELLGLSILLILGMLFSLLRIVETIYKNRADFAPTLPGLSFTLYSSWVFIATIVNISAYLVQIGWDGFGISDSIWTIIILFVAIAFVLFYLTRFKNAIFPLPIAWAFFGIYSAYGNGQLMAELATIIQGVLIAGIIVFLILSVWTFIRNNQAIFPKTAN